MITSRLPKFLKKYFWEVDFSRIDCAQRKKYVLKRILEYGDQRAVKWMLSHFDKKLIKSLLMNCRGLSRKSANFWALIFNVPKKEVLCLKRFSSPEPKTAWKY